MTVLGLVGLVGLVWWGRRRSRRGKSDRGDRVDGRYAGGFDSPVVAEPPSPVPLPQTGTWP